MAEYTQYPSFCARVAKANKRKDDALVQELHATYETRVRCSPNFTFTFYDTADRVKVAEVCAILGRLGVHNEMLINSRLGGILDIVRKLDKDEKARSAAQHGCRRGERLRV